MVERNITNFEGARRRLQKYIPANYRSGDVYTLDRITELLELLGNPQEKFKAIHVAGTSGKTSTAYYSAALLKAAGHKVGLTVSPHVDEVNERVQINLVPMEEDEFCRELQEFMGRVDESKLSPTYYELLVAFAYYEFAKHEVEYAVIEVGLGGRLDGSNTIKRPDKVCVIADIGYDHTNVLGSTLVEITKQKAGIIHEGNAVFMHLQSPEVVSAVRARCEEVKALLHVVDSRLIVDRGLPDFQNRNFALAYEAVSFALLHSGHPALHEDQVLHAQTVRIPARMEIFPVSGQLLIIDGSHNGQKMRALITSLRHMYPTQKIVAMVAFLSGDDVRWRQAVDELLPALDTLLVTSFTGGQDMPKSSVGVSEVVTYMHSRGFTRVVEVRNPSEAYHTLLKYKHDILLVTGSFYLLHYVRPLIRHEGLA